jgi:hypothetical protein
MKARMLECNVCRSVESEKHEKVKNELKEKKREIEKTRVILNKLERQYQKMLDTEIDELYYDRCW